MERADGLKASDLVKVIKACSEAGVKRFEMQGVVIDFGQAEVQEQVIHEPVTAPFYQEMKEDEPDQEFIETQMLIDDPLALEEMVMQGDNEA